MVHTPWPLRLVLFRYRHVTSNDLQLLSLPESWGLFIYSDSKYARQVNMSKYLAA